MGHDHALKIADEERQKHPHYRSIIEHDGFFWQRSINQVMRDIIKEYMEDMKHHGGVGGMSKVGEESQSLASEDMTTHSNSTQKSESRRNSEMPKVNQYQGYTLSP